MKLIQCTTTKLWMPREMFPTRDDRKHGYDGRSYLGILWMNVSQRAVNGRYASARRNHYPNTSHHRHGIRMLDEWVENPTAFAWYVLSELGFPRTRGGQRLTLDRIDNTGDYVPGNLRWATPREQMLNRGGFPQEYLN